MVIKWWIVVSELGDGEAVVLTVEAKEDEEAIGKKKDVSHNYSDTM